MASVTAVLDLLKRRDDRKHQARSHWRDLGAGWVKNLQIFIDDARPEDVLEHPWLGDTSLQHVDALKDRRRIGIREPLRTFSVGHPSRQIRHRTDDVINAVRTLLGALEASVQARNERTATTLEALVEGENSREEVQRLVRLLREEIHRDDEQ